MIAAGILDRRADRDPRRRHPARSSRSTSRRATSRRATSSRPRALDFESAGPDRRRARGGARRGRPAVRLHDRERHRHRGRAAARVRGRRRPGRHDLRRRPHAGEHARRCSRPRSPTCPSAAQTTLAGLDPAGWAAVRDRGGPRPRRDAAHGAARHRGRGDPDPPVGPDGRRPRRGGADARRPSSSARWSSPTPRSAPSSPTRRAAERGRGGRRRSASRSCQGEVIVRNGDRLDRRRHREDRRARACASHAPDVASFGGWLLLAVLVVGMLLAWIWRFRPGLWHRDNVLLLIGLLRRRRHARPQGDGRTADRCRSSCRPRRSAMLLAILLDASLATVVMALVAIIGGAVNGGSLEFATYVFLGGMAGDRRRPARRPAPGLRPGGGRGLRRQRARRARSSRCSARATCAASSSCGSPRRPRRRGRASPRSGRSRCSARCSGS